MTSREVRTPIDASPVIELGNRTYRKQILKHQDIDYNGRTITFDKQYCDNVAKAFRDKAYSCVPLVMADSDNRHSLDPERARGTVLGVESADDGLYATVRLSESATATEDLINNFPDLGVSVRVREDYRRPDGEHFDAALQHVLLTFDGKVTGLRPWESVDLSNDPGTEVIDLTHNDSEEAAMADDNEAGPDLADLIARGVLTVADPDALSAAGVDWADTDTGGEGWPVDGDGDPDFAAMSDDEFGRWAQATADESDDEQPDSGHDDDAEDADDEPAAEPAEHDLVAASNAYTGALDLANADDPRIVELSAQVAAERERNLAMQRRADAADYRTERDQLSRRIGLPPFLLDLAQPLLEGSGRTVELSNGDEVDAGKVMREFLGGLEQTMRALDVNLLDLSQSKGQVLTGAGELDDAGDAERKSKAGRFVAGLAG